MTSRGTPTGGERVEYSTRGLAIPGTTSSAAGIRSVFRDPISLWSRAYDILRDEFGADEDRVRVRLLCAPHFDRVTSRRSGRWLVLADDERQRLVRRIGS